jgi:hypothetical protein
MKRLHSLTAIAFTGLVGFTSLCAPMAAVASEQGKKNTALGLGAAALGLLLTQKNKLTGLVAAGGAAYAYSQYDKDVKNRHQRERDGYYDRGSNNDYRTNRDTYNNRYNQNSRYRTNRDNGNDPYNQDSGYRNNRDDYNNRYNQDSGYRYHDNNGSNQEDRQYSDANDNRIYSDSGSQDSRNRDRIDSVHNRSASRRTGSAFSR